MSGKALVEELAMEQNTMQQMFGAFPNSPDIMQRNARTFWENQTELLDRMQVFANGWFERRHAGTKAALEACERMCGAKTPAESLEAYQKWVGGVFERISADGLACQGQLRALTEGLAPSLVPSTTQEHGRVAKEEPAPVVA